MARRTSQKAKKIWAQRRHLSQVIVTLLFILGPLPLPFVPGLEHGLLKVDFELWRVHFFGLTLVPGIMHILALGLILVLFAIAVMASLYGKVFCGWICPQNINFELFDWVHTQLRKRYPRYRKSKRMQKATDFGMALTVASLVTWVANGYFIGASPIFTTAMSIFLMAFVVLEAHYLKHDFCRNACPYAFLQQSFADTNSLHVRYEPNRPGAPCGVCTACEKACYVDIDIKKQHFDIDCTLCGACVDACAQVYSKSTEPPLLTFEFGTVERQKETRFNFLGVNDWRKVAIASGFLFYCGLFVFAILSRPTVSFRVDYPLGGGRDSTMMPYIENGKHTNKFTLRLNSLEAAEAQYRMELDPAYRIIWEDDPSVLARVPAFDKLKLRFKVQYEGEDSPAFMAPITFRLLSLDGKDTIASQESVFKAAKLEP
jgi:polyferredoxin